MKIRRYIWLNIWFAILIVGFFVFYSHVVTGRKRRALMRYDLRPDTTLARGLILPVVPDSMRLCGVVFALTPALRSAVWDGFVDFMRDEAQMIALMRRLNRWRPEIDQVLQAHQLPTDLVYLAAVRTALNPAYAAPNAWGIWALDAQWFAPDSASLPSLRMDAWYDARLDIKTGAAAFAERLSDSITHPKTVTAWFAQHELGQQQLLGRWLAMASVLRHPAIWGLALSDRYLPVPYSLNRIQIEDTLDVAAFAKQHNIEVSDFLSYNPMLYPSYLHPTRYPTPVPLAQHTWVYLPKDPED